ncbi:sensor histidine kinase [Cellulomonas fimi]|uniref:histidine kinase n=1 Tax=Cellulomonas fimi (strain ATCC 484 / DSM 20113 / JCM 1341 / CCUG 24087 / LMG 16345 / NBRC 15513 / NCIMB 8980 / NCTC 7547 / NRS-133) TaxID=590998 RepID=F4H7L2_CELFA|nr:histidine kinase [Cellulomonas fimi]AEE44569.1 integral membrane sensor signal transduction histidine kinase [Cellulomonas fimi ATCC 484]NNH06455.1 two-component sensor histidine kinase [Cellulomonas fimi]VEH26650.1 Sensor histidine kinase desK [Cellulomonas fimi]
MTSADGPGAGGVVRPSPAAAPTRTVGGQVAAGWESGPVVIRRAVAVRAARSADETLTEQQVRGASPVARLVTARPWVMDVAVAGAMAVVGLVGTIFVWETAGGAVALGLYPRGSDVVHSVTRTWLLGTAVGATLLLVRRTRPITVTALLAVAALASLWADGVLGVLGACLACALYSVAAERGAATAWAVCGGVLVVVTTALWQWQDIGLIEIIAWFGEGTRPRSAFGPGLEEPLFSAGRRMGSVLLLLALLLLGVAVGSAERARRLHAADLVERYRALARERDQSAALARAAERQHIAREMHDVVAHNLTVMVALAGGADAAFDRAPDRSREALRQVARTGRTALTDMQRVLGALGPAGGDATEPTDVDLTTVVERFAVTGVPVTATGLDVALPQDTAVRLAVVRILGEALTNVLRHAPGAPSVEVAVRRTPAGVEVEVTDSGGTRPGGGGGTGRGIVGMRERAALLGGHVEAGPRPGGGWRVHAELPWTDDEGDAR